MVASKKKFCELGSHEVYSLWKAKRKDSPSACKDCWQKQYQKSKKSIKPVLIDGIQEWYKYQISIMPSHCENCGAYLNKNAPWGPKAYICHIIPKRIFKSVQTNDDNVWYGCIMCHTNYDNSGSDKISKMSVISLIKERFKLFKDNIIEKNEIPSFLF